MFKAATRLAAFFLLFVSLAHLYRYFAHTPIQIGTVHIPDWVSLPVFVTAALLSLLLFLASRKL